MTKLEEILGELHEDITALQRSLADAVTAGLITESAYDYAFLHSEEIDIQRQYIELALENK